MDLIMNYIQTIRQHIVLYLQNSLVFSQKHNRNIMYNNTLVQI